jgi:uncharacterized membrane protein HdeD (DUF308 family)
MDVLDKDPSERGSGSLIWSLVMIVAGLVAIAVPFAASLTVAVLVSWLFFVGGVIHIAVSISHRKQKSFGWKLLLGIIYAGTGLYLMFMPIVGIWTLTLFVGSIFMVEGLFEVFMYFSLRKSPGAIWFLFDGALAFVLGAFVWASTGAGWVIGMLVGINLVVSGVSRLALHTSGKTPLKEA